MSHFWESPPSYFPTNWKQLLPANRTWTQHGCCTSQLCMLCTRTWCAWWFLYRDARWSEFVFCAADPSRCFCCTFALTCLSHLLQPASVSAAAFLPAPCELLFPRTMWIGGEALGNEWNRWQSSSRCCQGSCSSCAPSSLFRVERKTLDRKDEEPVVGPLAEGKECSAAFWNLPADLCQSAGN